MLEAQELTHHKDPDADTAFYYSPPHQRGTSVHAGLQTLQGLWASTVSIPGPWLHLEPLPLLYFDFDADPDPASKNNGDQDQKPRFTRPIVYACLNLLKCWKWYEKIAVKKRKSAGKTVRNLRKAGSGNPQRGDFQTHPPNSRVPESFWSISYPKSSSSSVVTVVFSGSRPKEKFTSWDAGSWNRDKNVCFQQKLRGCSWATPSVMKRATTIAPSST